LVGIHIGDQDVSANTLKFKVGARFRIVHSLRGGDGAWASHKSGKGQ